MIHFAVVIGTSARTVDDVTARVQDELDRTRILDGRLVVRRARSGTWAAVARTAPDPIAERRLHATDDALAVVNGAAFFADRDHTPLDERALIAFCESGAPVAGSAINGAYNFVGIHPSLGLVAHADFSGMFPLYWHQGDGFAVFTNRSRALAPYTNGDVWDTRALAWLIGHSNLFGDRMPTRGASYLPPGMQARVDWSDGCVRLEQSPEWMWPGPSDVPDRSQLGPDDWDEITESLVEGFRAVRSLGEDVRLMLSGGKDSRLCLALAKAAGLRGRLRCVTNGGPDSPEVSCAAAVAGTAGFDHELSPLPTTPVERTEWRRLRQHVHRYEAIVCPRDGDTEPRRGTTLTIKGFGGELYRGPGGHAKRFKRTLPTTVDEMAKMFVDYHQRHDPLAVLRPAESEFQARWLQSWVREHADRVRLDLLPEKFYVDYRLGHWNGPLCQAAPTDVRLDLLLSRDVAARYLMLPPTTRGSDRLHFEVMRRTAPELLELAIVNDVWSPDIVAGSPIQLPSEPFPTAITASARTLRSGRWRFLDEERDAIVQLLRDADRSTAMGEICDLDRLRSAVGVPTDLSNIQMKSVESSIVVALALLGRTEPVLDAP